MNRARSKTVAIFIEQINLMKPSVAWFLCMQEHKWQWSADIKFKDTINSQFAYLCKSIGITRQGIKIIAVPIKRCVYNGDEGALYKMYACECDLAREFNHFPLVFVSINGYFLLWKSLSCNLYTILLKITKSQMHCCYIAPIQHINCIVLKL